MKGREVKNNNVLKFLSCLMVILLLSGCTRQELDDKLIIASIGVDKTDDNKVKLTMGLIDTRPTEQQEAKGVHVYSSVGETIFDAARTAIIKLGKQPIWPYIKIVVFGPTVSKDDIFPFLDFFNRNNEVQPNPYILFSKVDAKEMIQAKVDFANIPAVIIEKQLEQQGSVSYIPSIKLHQFTEMMLTPGRIGYAAIIESEQKGNKVIPKVQNTAVIKDAKWIGNLNKKATRGLLWVKKEVKGGILVTPALTEDGKIALEILDKTKVSIRPKIKRGNIQRINVNVKSTVSIGEMMTHTDMNEKNLNEIEKLAEQLIEEEILSAIGQAKNMEVDFLGFGEAVHRKYPTFWKKNKKDWNRNFPNLPIQVEAQVDIRNLGLFNH